MENKQQKLLSEIEKIEEKLHFLSQQAAEYSAKGVGVPMRIEDDIDNLCLTVKELYSELHQLTDNEDTGAII